MCMCGKPVKNGEPGYSWDGKGTHVRKVNPPDLKEGEKLLHDEPGRCGGLDSHSFHYRVVKIREGRHADLAVLVRHGSGDERFDLDLTVEAALAALDSTGRYWMLNALYHAGEYAAQKASERESARWRQAAAEKRIRTRKMPGRDAVKVWIEPKPTGVA